MIEIFKNTWLNDGEYVAPSIKVIKNAIDNPQQLINMAKNAPKDRWTRSAIGGDMEFNESIRNSNEISIPYGLKYPPEFFNIAQKIYLYAQQYASENLFTFTHMEEITMLEYPIGEGYYDRHTDQGPDFPRAMSAILYLNDVEEGGGTWFDKFDLMINPEAGKLLLFPSNFPYTHQAMPPTSGPKYILVTWFGMQINTSSLERYYGNDNR